MDKNNYPPLVLMSKSLQIGKEFSSRKLQLMNLRIKGADKLDVNSYIDIFLSEYFMNPFKEHPFSDLDKTFFYNMDVITESTGLTKDMLLADGAEQLKTEFKDFYLAPVLLEEWSKSKQVYKPDRDFAKALLKTQKLQITRDMLTHLPYDYFYIDLLDISEFNPIVGIFTFIHHKIKNGIKYGADITIYLLTEDMVYFSHYLSGIYGENGIITIDFNDEAVADYVVYDTKTEIVYDPEDIKVNRNEVSLFVLQLISYLSIERPQIEDSEYTKNTYIKKAPGSKVKNKWNEVQIFDVGITYGRAYRKQIEEYKNNIDRSDTKHHKSPIPHMRSAHWQRYWTGKGRTECKVKWIEPTFVGAKSSKNIVIHKVS